MQKPKLPAVSSTPSAERSQKRKMILKQIETLFSAYRKDQFSDAEGYAASLVAVFEGYPDSVIIAVTDPRTGVQRESEWPPTISRIVTACEVHMQTIARRARLANHGKPKEQPLLEAPRDSRPTLEQLKAKFGENYGLTLPERPKPKPGPSWAEVIAHYRANPHRIAALISSCSTETENDTGPG